MLIVPLIGYWIMVNILFLCVNKKVIITIIRNAKYCKLVRKKNPIARIQGEIWQQER